MSKSREKTRRMIKAITILIRNTTWKCGKIERLVVNYLRRQISTFGRVKIPVREMLQHFKLDGKRKNEFFDAIKRLEKRHIIRVEGF
ncbi:hypothetical protein KAS14_00480 [Candidatus Bathyarchaeota archaeon]|nr:hypothetical protein [Candidatus Bathyarchaeota archaeon]